MWYIDSVEYLKDFYSPWLAYNYSVYACFESFGGCTGLQMYHQSTSTYGHILKTAMYQGQFTVEQPLYVTDLQSIESIYDRVYNQNYQQYGFSQDCFFSQTYYTYGNTLNAWPNKSLAFWKFNPASGNRLDIGSTENVWVIDNIDVYNNQLNELSWMKAVEEEETPEEEEQPVNEDFAKMATVTAAAITLVTASLFWWRTIKSK